MRNIVVSPLNPVSPFLVGDFDGQELSFPHFICTVFNYGGKSAWAEFGRIHMVLRVEGLDMSFVKWDCPVTNSSERSGYLKYTGLCSITLLFQYVKFPFQWTMLPWRTFSRNGQTESLYEKVMNISDSHLRHLISEGFKQFKGPTLCRIGPYRFAVRLHLIVIVKVQGFRLPAWNVLSVSGHMTNWYRSHRSGV